MRRHPRRFLLVRYEADDLEPGEAETIRKHLEVCEVCRCFIRALEKRRREFLKKHSAGQVVPELLDRARAGWLRRLWRRFRRMSEQKNSKMRPRWKKRKR